MKTYSQLFLVLIIAFVSCAKQEKKEFFITGDYVTIKENGKLISEKWYVDPEVPLDLIEVECKKEITEVEFSEGEKNIRFFIKRGEEVDFDIVKANQQKARTRIKGIKPILNFTKAYIQKHKGKTTVEIPEVSELVNVLVALHKDAKKDRNMIDSSTEYFQRIQEYFKPYKNHPMIDTIQKYISGLRYIESINDSIFSNESYRYYYRLKMNACAFNFDNNGTVKNNGNIRDMAYGWSDFNAMKDSLLMADFARVSNFRAFYKKEQPYYNSLIKTYSELNPIHTMREWLESKFDFSYDNFTVYFSPLVFGSHAAQRFEDNGFKQTIMFVAKAEKNEKISTIQNILEASRVLFTEIDHNYVNPVSDKFLDKIDARFATLKDWQKGEASSNYNSPYMIFNEYMTFALYSLYISDNYPAKEVAKFLPKMEELMANYRGFYKFKEFNRKMLSLYKQNPSITIHELYTAMLS